MCGIREQEVLWNSWDEIDIADVPKFTSAQETNEQLGENPFEGNIYRLEGANSYTLEITKPDMDGNIIKIEAP